MPDLPTITVSTEQQARILDALKDHFGTTTQAETVREYRKWLSATLKDIVFRYEALPLEEQKAVLRGQVESTLIDPIV
jgi:hypothetical protein